MQEEQIRVMQLINEIGFIVVDEAHAAGQLSETPVSLTLLSNDPLQLMFGFKVNSSCRDTSSLLNIMAEISGDQAKLSVVDGFAWLNLYDLNGATTEAIIYLLQQIVTSIESSNLRLDPGCLKCGSMEQNQIVCTQGRPSRVCAKCISTTIKKTQKLQLEANRGNLSTTFTLPGVCAFVASLWVIFWMGLDFFLSFYRVNQNRIEIDHYTTMFILCVTGVVGYCFGMCIGATLQKSRLLSKAPITMGILLVLIACLGGEIAYIALIFFGEHWRF